jgi:hypothetical protein
VSDLAASPCEGCGTPLSNCWRLNDTCCRSCDHPDGEPGPLGESAVVTDDQLRCRFAGFYPDLRMLSPVCPVCGRGGSYMLAPSVHPMGFCVDEECPSLSWDPSVDYSADQAVLSARVDYIRTVVDRVVGGDAGRALALLAGLARG